MPLLNTSTLISNISGAASKFSAVTQNFNPSDARLATANLLKGGASSIGSSLGKTLGGSLGGPLGGALGGALGSSLGGALGGSISNAIPGSLGNALGGISSAVGNLSGALSGAGGALSGVMRSGIPGLPTISFGTNNTTSDTNGTVPADDWRIRVRCPAFDNLTIVFPVLPSITFSYTANYSSQRLTHSNYASYFYESSEVQAFQITAGFPITTAVEGRYLLTTINFFKATTKMYFGTSNNGGNPPPIVFLNGYGTPYLSDVPCIVTSFQHTMPNNVDYIKCDNVRLPTYSEITVTLQPVVSRAKAGQFNHNDYQNSPNSGFI